MLSSVNLLFLAATCFISVYAYQFDDQRPFNEDGDNPRMIIEGRVVQRHEFPFIAYIEIHWIGNNSACTGSIISPYHILSALHCFKKSDNFNYWHFDAITRDLVVYVGSPRRRSGQRFKVESLTSTSKQYTYDYDDIAILKLKNKIIFDYINTAPVTLAFIPPKVGETLVVAGHGWTIERGREHQDFENYRVGFVNVLYNSSYITVKNTEFIAGGYNQGVYRGDSGGPALRSLRNMYYQVGITVRTFIGFLSTGVDVISHGTYVTINPFCNFITETTRDMVICSI